MRLPATVTLAVVLLVPSLCRAQEEDGPLRVLSRAELELEKRRKAPPRLECSPTSLTCSVKQGETARLRLTVRNAGGQLLKWTVASAPAWVSFVEKSGVLDFEQEKNLSLAVRATNGFLAGTVRGNIVLEAPGTAGSPATVVVVAEVVERPRSRAGKRLPSRRMEPPSEKLPARPLAPGESHRMTFSFEYASFSNLDDYARGNTDEPVAKEEGMVPSFRYYLTSIDDTEKPYRLQPFLQQASYLEGRYEMGPGETDLLALSGRYFFPVSPLALTAELAFGKALVARATDLPDPDDFFADEGHHSRIGGGAVYYLTEEKNLALEGSIAFEWTVGRFFHDFPGFLGDVHVDWEIDRTIFILGVRYVTSVVQTGGWLEVGGGFRMLRYNFESDHVVPSQDWYPDGIDKDLMGVVVDARYFFSKQLSAGVTLATDTDLLSISAGYMKGKGFQAELEWGTEGALAGPFFRLKAGLQF